MVISVFIQKTETSRWWSSGGNKGSSFIWNKYNNIITAFMRKFEFMNVIKESEKKLNQINFHAKYT